MLHYDPEKYHLLEPLWPHGLLRAGIVSCGLMAILICISLIYPELFLPGDIPPGPHNPPGHVVPWPWAPWRALARSLGGAAASLLALGVALALCLLPYWDRGPRRPLARRPVFRRVCWALVMAWCLLLIGGSLP